MGDIKRKHKVFNRPRQLFDRERIDQENEIVEKYGLKNKREIWRANTKISDIRRKAKHLINNKDDNAKVEFFNKLNNMGFVVNQVSDVLGLTANDLLERRLQTFVFKKGLANTPKQARQFITHKHVLVNGSIVNSPSMWVMKDMESKIELKPRKVKTQKTETIGETTEEETE